MIVPQLAQRMLDMHDVMCAETLLLLTDWCMLYKRPRGPHQTPLCTANLCGVHGSRRPSSKEQACV